MLHRKDADKNIFLTQQKKITTPRFVVSDKDPFMNKPRVFWKAMHPPVASTEELMQSLEPYETRKVTDKDWMRRFND